MPADAIQFNNIPGSGLVAPIFTAEFNSGGQYTTVDRFVIIGTRGGGALMPVDTPVRISSQQEADSYAGMNSVLREMARFALRNAPALPIYLMATTTGSLTARVMTITITAPAVGVGYFEIQGERIQINVSSTDTVTTVARAIQAAVNNYYNPLTGAQLPVTATAAVGVVTLTSTYPGVLGNEIDVYAPKKADNVFNSAGVFTFAQTTPGDGVPTGLANTLAALGDNPADFVISPWSDSTSISTYAAWSNDVSGRWAWSRQSYGHVWAPALDNYSGLTTLGLTLNDRHLSLMGCVTPGAHGSPTPSYLWNAAAAARLFPRLTDVSTGNIARAHDGLELIDVKPPRDPSLWPNYNARNGLASSGISTWRVAADGTVLLSKVITTYQTGPSGNPDSVFRDIQSVYQCSEGMKFMRAELGVLFGQKALVHSNPGQLSAAVTPADIKAGFVGIYQELCANLVFQDADTFAKLIQVRINPNNPNRVDVFCPMERVNPFDILAINATIYQQYPSIALLPIAA